ncbi:MAG: hypothetical protein F4Z82_19760 [Caldilineaceae bacterium SB0668_bin_21]|nr:hypothetical protein [Caldilineaceae bacterium SB0668_bin_21]
MRPSPENGAVPGGWQLVRLGDVAEMSQGGTPRKSRSEYWDGDIPFVTGADLTELRIGSSNARSFLTAEGLYSGDTAVCEPGALLLATRTAVGLVGMATEIMGASQDITRLVANGRVESDYLCRVLLRLGPSLQRRQRGTTIQGVTREDVTSLSILLPPLPEQRAIVAVLDSIDVAIEGTEAVIAATEQLRDSLLHELLMRGVPGWHTEWKEAPGVGTIPACWEVVRLGDVAEMSQGGTPRKSRPEYWDGDIPFVTGADLTELRIGSSNARSFLTAEGLYSGDTAVCEPGALLLATRTAVGLVGMATEIMGASQDITRLVANGRVESDYLCRVLLRLGPSLQRRQRGTTIQGVTREDVTSLSILLPPLPEQRAIVAVLDSIDVAIERTEAIIATTEQLRDSLLHELLTHGIPGWHSEESLRSLSRRT